MLKSEREQLILAMLERQSIVSVHDLYAELSKVSPITVRRDLARLADEGKLLRVRGGIKRIPSTASPTAPPDILSKELGDHLEADLDLADDDIQSLRKVDVIILPPIEGHLAKTIHVRARRTDVLCLDESCPDSEGVYLGIDNNRAGIEVGLLAGQNADHNLEQIHCLIIGHDGLTNTRERAFGFLQGLREAFAGEVHAISVDAGGVYMEAFRQARDAFEAVPQISIVFGINDHSALAAIDAARNRQITDLSVYCVGGEGSPVFGELEKGGMLKGFAAMFPQVVARHALRAVAKYYSEEKLEPAVITPHRLITPENFADYYRKKGDNWELNQSVLEELAPVHHLTDGETHSLLFIQHYPTHHWYHALSDELEHCAEEIGYEYHTGSVKMQVLDELRRTRHQIATRASRLVREGDTILVNGGIMSRQLARSLKNIAGLTVITNSLEIINELSDSEDVKLMLTGGEFRARTMDLVGPSVTAVLKGMRIDYAFLSVDGISTLFGASCRDERSAKCLEIFSEFSRRTVILADHSILGVDANFKAIDVDDIDDIVSDFGVPPKQRVKYATQGLSLIIAEDPANASVESHAGP